MDICKNNKKKINDWNEKIQVSSNSLESYGLEDCAELDCLSLESIRKNLEIRFKRIPQEIYTWIGFVLISVNPYHEVNTIYNDEVKMKFLDGEVIHQTPHIYGVGQNCYNQLIQQSYNSETRSQTVIITGESGAGKTEACRHLVNFLTFASLNAQRRDPKKLNSLTATEIKNGDKSIFGNASDRNDEVQRIPKTIEEALISAGTILEAFGSAKTTNNDNSSRFGKLIGIRFNSNGQIQSAHLKTYLLTKSRVTKVLDGEQNFTIFHSLIQDWQNVIKQDFDNELKIRSQFDTVSESDSILQIN